MPFFMKKPIKIEAKQLTSENYHELSLWIAKSGYEVRHARTALVPGVVGLVIHTLEGDMVARYGDWIIKGVEGEFYPCKPDIFEKIYYEVQADA